MLLQLAIADAYGAAFEFTTPEFIAKQNHLTYQTHPSRPDENILPGHYTDDTQMSIGTIEALLESDYPTSFDFVLHYIGAYERDKRAGYSKRIQAALKAGADGMWLNHHENLEAMRSYAYNAFNESLGGTISSANGCIMRTLPLGMLPSPALVTRAAINQAVTTHPTSDGIHFTIVASLAAHALYHGKADRRNVRHWVANHMEIGIKPRSKNDKNIVLCEAGATIKAALYLIENYDALDSILYEAVKLGGDTDSVAAVAVGLASLCRDIDPDGLPNHLVEGFERKPNKTGTRQVYGKYAAAFLNKLEARLFKKYPRRPV